MVLPFSYLFLLLKHPWLRERLPPKEKSKTRQFMRSSRGFYVISFLTLLVFVQVFVASTRARYVRAVILYANSTIQRIAPYIDDKTEKQLWAQYRSIRNAKDYYAFYDSLQAHLKQFGIPDYGVKPL